MEYSIKGEGRFTVDRTATHLRLVAPGYRDEIRVICDDTTITAEQKRGRHVSHVVRFDEIDKLRPISAGFSFIGLTFGVEVTMIGHLDGGLLVRNLTEAEAYFLVGALAVWRAEAHARTGIATARGLGELNSSAASGELSVEQWRAHPPIG